MNFDFQNFGTKSCDSLRHKFWYHICPSSSSDMARIANLQPQGTALRHAPRNFKKRLRQRKVVWAKSNFFLRTKYILVDSKSTRTKKIGNLTQLFFVQKSCFFNFFKKFDFLYFNLDIKRFFSSRQKFWYLICPSNSSDMVRLINFVHFQPKKWAKNGYVQNKFCVCTILKKKIAKPLFAKLFLKFSRF